MKTTMTISVDADLKRQFSDFSKQVGTNPTNLLNMLMKQTISSREIRFRAHDVIDVEIEAFDQNEIDSFSQDFQYKSQKNTKKLAKLLADV